MPLNFSNVNFLWASILVETLYQLGLKIALVCPGSRSAPLAVEFAQHPQIESIPILDERSAAFFALGLAQRSQNPVVVVCTSGTAGANFFPAVIEAKECKIPLLVLTADRPPESRHCHGGQTIDQLKLFGTYPNWQLEITLPSLQIERLTYLRQTLIVAWERSQFPVAGPVHLNLPFADPLAPLLESNTQALFPILRPDSFFRRVGSNVSYRQIINEPFDYSFPPNGLIIAGLAQPPNPESYSRAIAQLSQLLQFPVLAEALSPIRNYASLNPNLISTYDLILRHSEWADQLKPQVVIQIGALSTSKELRHWLEPQQVDGWIIDPSDRNLDPLHGCTTHLRVSIEEFLQILTNQSPYPQNQSHSYLQQWKELEIHVRTHLDRTLTELTDGFEGKVAWILSQHLPAHTPLFVANSMPSRDMEWFWAPSDRAIQPYFNRGGGNGIDGILSTALGVAHRNRPTVLLTGDLSLLHDTNGLLLFPQFVGHLTILLINNRGGGIFELLPISQFDPPFENFFSTPQSVEFGALATAYGIEYELIHNWQQLQQKIQQLPQTGIRLLEFRCDRKADAQWRKLHLGEKIQSDGKN
ncbi:MAG: 2-succinyl-5-enolpyruvyl-6-hydroxy-3-cyclohexene-1-carboxylic-acid synthase [Cyanobacteria bacterium WB6_1B_304]|nr:2-succinyl-5-enolpyruvyl-6-hydroxy-3-cyclohexene-1-carboxylic-acid synthase [Cyanobacteria bacterium WB6_1B_304]